MLFVGPSSSLAVYRLFLLSVLIIENHCKYQKYYGIYSQILQTLLEEPEVRQIQACICNQSQDDYLERIFDHIFEWRLDLLFELNLDLELTPLEKKDELDQSLVLSEFDRLNLYRDNFMDQSCEQALTLLEQMSSCVSRNAYGSILGDIANV